MLVSYAMPLKTNQARHSKAHASSHNNFSFPSLQPLWSPVMFPHGTPLLISLLVMVNLGSEATFSVWGP